MPDDPSPRPGRIRRLARRLRRWLGGLGTPATVGLAVAGLVLVGGSSALAYRTYDWVEHDNDFCLSCHLMVDPYESFAQSAHRGLGCKACHKPTFVGRSQMALTQIIDNPDSLTAHAEVPNEKCAGCHVDGDPDRWEQISNSVGHRIHLESADSALQGLQCVECHSTSLHQFAATDQTCSRSGCHTDVDIQLGRMGDFTIHCVACHAFGAPADGALASAPPGDPTGSPFAGALRPEAEECLSCHVMRTLVDMPDDEPHDASCGTCHDPHRQTTPAEAVETCASAGCHTEPETLSPFHRGVDDVMADCAACHQAHDWGADGGECATCHEDAAGDAPRPGVGSSPGDGAPFDHGEHTAVACAECHSAETAHGTVDVTSPGDCLGCHHTAPTSDGCVQCHEGAATTLDAHSVTRTVRIADAVHQGRQQPFVHAPHADVACAQCHTEGPTLAVDPGACAGCHEEHHEATLPCASCHSAPPEDAHTVEVHLGCGGAGCHERAPASVRAVPRTRSFCLGCHQDLFDHRPEGNCEDCHTLPEPTR